MCVWEWGVRVRTGTDGGNDCDISRTTVSHFYEPAGNLLRFAAILNKALGLFINLY